MDLDDARSTLSRLTSRERSDPEMPDTVMYAIHAKEHPEDAPSIHWAMATLLVDGSSAEQGEAESFFNGVPALPVVVTWLVTEYERRNLTARSAVAKATQHVGIDFEDEARTTIRRLFESDPLRHVAFVVVIARLESATYAWRRIEQTTAATNDPDLLYAVYCAADRLERVDDFIQLVLDKPRDAIDRLSRMMTYTAGVRLRKAAGLT